MSKRSFIFYSLFFIISLSASAQTKRVLSPDRLTYLEVTLADGHLTYTPGYRQLVTKEKQVVVKGKKKGKKSKRTVVKTDTLDVPVLDASPLGICTSIGDWTEGLTFKEFSYKDGNFDKHYQLR